MKNLKLRGKKNKDMFIENHIITCTWHSILPPNTLQKCCCGDTLSQKYFLFNYTDKNEENENFFYAGASCAKYFKDVANIPLPHFIDPFENLNEYDEHIPINNENEKNILDIHRIKRIPENQEFITIVSLIHFIWSPNIKGYLYDRKIKLIENPTYKLFSSDLKILHKAISITCKNNHEQTLNAVLQLKAEEYNRKLKNYKFPTLVELFHKEGFPNIF